MKPQSVLRFVFALFILSLAGHARAQHLAVSGRVVDATGKPVADVEVASSWSAEGGAVKAHQPVMTDAQGRFAVKLNDFGQPLGVLALDKHRKTAGLVAWDKKSATADVTVKLEPAVHVTGSFFCKELNSKPSGTSMYLSTVDGFRFLYVDVDSKDAAFSFFLPPGKYKTMAYGPDIKTVHQDLTLAADQLVVDLKTIDVPASEIAKHRGKAPPAWHISDARGVKKDVTLADYMGKWVLVEFFTHWCGPCVGRSLPALMDFYDEHKEQRGQFEILAVHVQYAKDFPDYDAKMNKVIKDVWHGHDLPFPVLLDSTDQTIKAFGIRGFPTTILIDPDGKLVGEASELELEKKLPPIPLALRLPRALDRTIAFGVADGELGKTLERLARLARVEIRLDEPALKAAGVSGKDTVPLKFGGLVSLRSALNLVLTAHSLTFVADDKGLVVTAKKAGQEAQPLSEPQKARAKRIAERLGAKTSFDFKEATLNEVVDFLEQATSESYVLDPAARRAGTLNPEAKLSGAAKEIPLREGLQKLLDSIGMTFVVQNEVVIITPKAK